MTAGVFREIAERANSPLGNDQVETGWEVIRLVAEEVLQARGLI